MTIDLNCDLGEGFGAWEMGNDAAMIDLATSVNIACGFHAGDATHVKAHGALSNVACEDDMTARAIAAAIKAVDRNLVFVVLANSKLVAAGDAAGLPIAHEVFADRAYEDDGSLVSRRKPGAVLHDPAQIAERVVRMVQDGAVVSVSGKVIKMRTDTVCIHGDTRGAVEIARGVRHALKDNGIDVAPFKTASS